MKTARRLRGLECVAAIAIASSACTLPAPTPARGAPVLDHEGSGPSPVAAPEVADAAIAANTGDPSSTASTRWEDPRAWTGSYPFETTTRSGDSYDYRFDVLEWDELVAAVVTVEGWKEHGELLCSARVADPSHLELLFEKHGPAVPASHEYKTGERIATIVRKDDQFGIEWAALKPIGIETPLTLAYTVVTPPAATGVPQGDAWSTAYPRDFMEVSSISARLDKLLGDQRQRLTNSFNIQSVVQRDGALVLMNGQMNRDSAVHGGVAYDIEHDEIHAFVYDPECKQRLDVWSENWANLRPAIKAWIRTTNAQRLPVREHRRSAP